MMKKPMIRKEDFVFSVSVGGVTYDVYHFRIDGSALPPGAKAMDGDPGTLAFALIGGEWTIALLQTGHLDEAAVRKAIEEPQPDDKEGQT